MSYQRISRCLPLGLLALLACAALRAQAPASCPGPATGAFTGCYYNNTTLSGDPAIVRTDSQINFSWGAGTPGRVISGSFSVVWQGNFAFQQGTYTFTATASDGIQLYIDGQAIINQWNDQAPTTFSASHVLTQGNHLIVVEYFEETGTSVAQVSWQNALPTTPAPVIAYFTATPSVITPGQPVTLSWSVSGATSIGISGLSGDFLRESSVTVSPAQTETYTLTASSRGATSMAIATVTVTAGGNPQGPTAPTLLSAQAVSGNEVDLAWTASTDRQGVAGYQIIRNGAVAGSVPGTALTWIDSTVTPQTTYTYTVQAYDAAGLYSSASNAIQTTTPAASEAPVISSFTATPSTITPGESVTLQWSVSGANTISIDPLGVMRGRSSVTVSPSQTTTYTLSAAGTGGTTTATVAVTVQTGGDTQPPTAPTLVSAIAPNSSTVELVWTASTDNVGVAGYQILRNGSATASVSGSTLKWSDHSVTAGSMYTYAVKAFDSAGNYSASSNTVQVTVPVSASAPVISSFTATPASIALGGSVTLAWTVSGASTLSINQGIGDVTGYSSSSVTVSPGATTTYILSASNGSGTSTASVTVTVSQSVGNQPPTVPTLTTAVAWGPNEVDLVWTASTDSVGVAGYQVIRDGAVIVTTAPSVIKYFDATVIASTTYSYSIKAFDTSGNYSAASNIIQVTTPAAPTLSVTWYGACWYNGTVNGVTGNFQAIDFQLTTNSPVALQGTLFFAPNCSPSNGTDNLNDFGTTLNSTHMIEGFSNHPNVIPSSAVYWFGYPTTDGMCPAGAPCSGCLNYTNSTPSCSSLP